MKAGGGFGLPPMGRGASRARRPLARQFFEPAQKLYATTFGFDAGQRLSGGSTAYYAVVTNVLDARVTLLKPIHDHGRHWIVNCSA